ncbi:hypothetical protein GCM10023175_24550 [Pseudonocardia xishanensis]|uniref:MFS transporter n=1 Tax=Pseudonocardia xishanensis TaxID=630995 RepID=A0ABP8RRH9_9PSEU
MTAASPKTPETESPQDRGGGWTAAIVVSFIAMVLVQEYTALSYTTVSIALPDSVRTSPPPRVDGC